MSSEGSIDMGRAYPLHDAAEVGDVEAIRALLDRHTRAMTGSSRGINGLAELGGGDKSDDEDDDDDDDEFDPFAVGLDLDGRDADGCTALHISLLHRQLEVLKVLIEAGATVSKRLEGSTPAHIAITMGGVGHVGSSTVPEGGGERFACDALDLLLHSDANHEQQPLWKDDRGQTLLHVAGHFGLSQCLKHLLVLPGAEEHLNAKERMGLRPIHLAAGGGHVEAVKVLLSSGADASTSSFAGLKPLHLAVARGHWDVARLLLDAGASADVTNKQGLTPAVIATKRGLSIPSFLPELGGQANPEEENAQHILPTRIYAHDLCMKHHSCPVITRSGPEPPPENVRRLKVILDPDSGVLTSPEFSSLSWERVAPRAQFADVLRVHDYSYVSHLQSICGVLGRTDDENDDGIVASNPDSSSQQQHQHGVGAIAHLDGDTAISRDSFEAAMRAAGSACAAVDAVCTGEARNAFCAVRPPGHHAGPRGLVKCANDADGSHGFCLLNNVAIAAAYARHVHRGIGIKRVAIVDFDVHHGNGTEEIVRGLVPGVEEAEIQLPFCSGKFQRVRYSPWLNEEDARDCLFVSVHGYGKKDENVPGWFYPGSGATHIPEIPCRSEEESPAVDGKDHPVPLILDIGMSQAAVEEIPGRSRNQWRDVWRKRILPALVKFQPDLILVSAGFDAHKKDAINFGYIRLVEEDYEWITTQLVSVANRCCDGRLVSVLEGGYRIQGGPISAFGRSVAAHVRSLLQDGCRAKPQWDAQDAEWESKFENDLLAERERKRNLKLEARMQNEMARIVQQEEAYKERIAALRAEGSAVAGGPSTGVVEMEADADAPPVGEVPTQRAKRQRSAVDYVELAKKLDEEQSSKKTS